MGWGLTRTQCQCNGTHDVSSQVHDSKQLLSACTPIITAAVKSTCGVRRMFVSAVILIVLLAAIYWVSLPHHQISLNAHQPRRIQPQVSRNVPERTDSTEAGLGQHLNGNFIERIRETKFEDTRNYRKRIFLSVFFSCV